jgi:dihydropyrimidine dehydrogenase (NAD+) subunit PreT
MSLHPLSFTESESPLLDELFKDIKPALNHRQALQESARCLYCYDAPCIKACPSDINIPSFIRNIHTGNLEGAASTIYESNILGGSCARVCPTEILCEESCVRNQEAECAPVLIGQLQRYATDNATFVGHPFAREAITGKRIAVVGAGPAGLSCAHRLALKGHEVDLFEAKPKAGGLNEYGIARYKMTEQFAQKEVEFILGVGGITLHTNTVLGQDIHLTSLMNDYDAVFLGIGLQGCRALDLANESHEHVINAVDYIEQLRQADTKDSLYIPKSAVVIGAGNTAIDIACQLKRLGSEEVALVYRRGSASMGATWHEQEIAKQHQVKLLTWSRPAEIILEGDTLTGMRFEKTHIKDGRLSDTGHSFDIACEAIFKAVGQTLTLPEGETLKLDRGKVKTADAFNTPYSNLFAGGDCTGIGQDLTVEAVQQGKLAALSIHDYLTPSA